MLKCHLFIASEKKTSLDHVLSRWVLAQYPLFKLNLLGEVHGQECQVGEFWDEGGAPEVWGLAARWRSGGLAVLEWSDKVDVDHEVAQGEGGEFGEVIQDVHVVRWQLHPVSLGQVVASHKLEE